MSKKGIQFKDSDGNEVYPNPFPVGAIYMSVDSRNPGDIFGGTWTKIEGKFLWATTSTPKVTGGSTTTNSHVLTIDEIPSHSHEETIQTGDGNFNTVCRNRTGGDRSRAVWPENAVGGWTNTGSGDIMRTMYNGGGKGHTHKYMPPYFEVYMWYRVS